MSGGERGESQGRAHFAVFDIGTNSVLMLVAELLEPAVAVSESATVSDGFVVVDEECVITRLGEGVAHSAQLSPAAVHRTLEALVQLSARAAGATFRGAVATAVLRDVADGAAFLAAATAALGTAVEVVSGVREADLVLQGVLGSFGALDGTTLIVDVGGGSTELVSCIGGHPETTRIRSIPLGAVRLTEAHFARDVVDPPPLPAIQAAQASIGSALDQVPQDFFDCERVVGVAGTVTTLAAVSLALERYDTNRVNKLELTQNEIAAQIARYRRTPRAKRERIVGLDPKRADIILAGALVIDELLRRTGKPSLQVCDRGVRWGLLRELAASVG